ncbi:uncharacterized protein LOC121875379 [Homarus americanus]|uniref:uncharacterized protein LOC121875379 n=1 Tax=Homarus americanus TaxID=6706 RepID=UPI001C47FAE3|nr:uncharacterized protein LOC121875379 [Homarus americanus]
MMQRMLYYYPHDVLSYLRQLHEQVAPLLHQISQRSRVLFLSQSRFRTHAGWVLFNMRTAFGDASSDWSEMLLMYYLRQYGNHHLSPSPPHVSYTSPTPITGSLQQHSPVPQGPAPNTVRPQTTRSIRDHLDPRETGGGVWWWDTGVPLNLAGISECEALYRRGLASHPLYNGHLLQCPDPQHAGRATLGDLVTMLLNLICNSVLGVHDGACCQ